MDSQWAKVNFFAISYGWDVMSGNRSKSAFFEGEWVTLSTDFRGNGASPINHCWCQSSRVIALSCGIKISAVRHLVLSQSTRVTDRRTDRQNYDSQDHPRICSRGKNCYFSVTLHVYKWWLAHIAKIWSTILQLIVVFEKNRKNWYS